MSSVARRFTAAALVASAIAVACKDAQVRTSSDRRDHSDATFAKRDNQEICRQHYHTDRTFSVENLVLIVSELPAQLARALKSIKPEQ